MQANRVRTPVKKLIGLGLLLVACRGSMTPKQAPAPGTPGAATPAAAVTAFMAAVKAGDLQAMSAVWGTSSGSVRNDLDRTTLEQRELYIMTCTKHDSFKIISDAAGPSGTRKLNIELTRGTVTRATDAHVVLGPESRWYVKEVVLAPLDAICLAK